MYKLFCDNRIFTLFENFYSKKLFYQKRFFQNKGCSQEEFSHGIIVSKKIPLSHEKIVLHE